MTKDTLEPAGPDDARKVLDDIRAAPIAVRRADCSLAIAPGSDGRGAER